MIDGNQNENPNGSHAEHGSSPHGGGSLSAMYHAVMKDGSVAGLAREGLKDIQDTFHEVAWGGSSHGREPGAPLTPLHRDVAADRDYHALYSTEREEGGVHGKEVQVAEESKPISWVERLFGRPKPNDGNDPNNLRRGRVLPDDQLENDKGRDR